MVLLSCDRERLQENMCLVRPSFSTFDHILNTGVSIVVQRASGADYISIYIEIWHYDLKLYKYDCDLILLIFFYNI